MGETLDSIASGLKNTINIPIDAAQGNFGKAADDFGGSFSDSIHGVDAVPVIGPYIGPAVAGFFGGPLGYGAAEGVQQGVEASRKGAGFNQAALAGVKGGALGAAGSYVGGALGNEAGSALSNNGFTSAGNFLNQTPANALGDSVGGQAVGSVAPFGSFAGNALGSTSIGSLAGSGAADALTSNMNSQALNGMFPPAAASGFSPTMSPQMGLPQSLSQFGSLNPNQQASNIASQGVYGGGNGPDETNYFLNLMNRQQFTNGNLNQQTNLSPIDQSYLSQLGISNYSNPTGLLQGISQYGT